jgi:acyl dehydratase
VIASLGGTALEALLRRVRGRPRGTFATPGPLLEQTIAPRPPSLVRDYVRHVGGDPSAYRGVLPPHLFPQWAFPLAARTLRGIPYPLERVLNAGCRMEVNGPLPAGEPLRATAQLVAIDDDGRRALLHQRVTTGPREAPEALVAHLYALVPTGAKGNGTRAGSAREPARVPAGATELAWFKLGADAGLAFAFLTGDFNPVHWVRPYARAFGFRSTILHGFATMARAIEGLNRNLFAGAVDRLATVDVKFTRPLLLPARVGLYLDGHACFVGDAPAGPAYLTGSFTERSET